LQNLALDNSRLANALWSCAQIDGAIQRGWLATLGQYPANKRIAHFLCELRQRLEWVGLADARGYKLPLTQEDIADAMGLSAVHVNRVIQSLRAENLINTAGHILVIPDLKRLEAFADFDPSDLLSYRVTDEPLAHTFSRSPRDNGCEEAPLISASLSGPADH
jgi:transcriptional regulator with XRE-family HTH domain